VHVTLARDFLEAAERHAERPALTRDGATFRHADLARGSLAFAAHLEREGFAPGERVAIVLENSAEFVVAYYGTLLAGGIAVPLSPAARAPDHRTWLEHASPSWVVGAPSDRELCTALDGLPSAPRRLPARADAATAGPSVADLIADDRRPRLVHAGRADAPATLLYTSGTTGRPKGVTLSQENLAHNYAAIVRYLGLGPRDAIVSVLPFCYSYGASVLHTHLRAGGHVVVAANFVYPQLVCAQMVEHRATGFAGVPSTYALLLARVQLADYDFGSLRYLTQAGGPMSPALAQRVREAFPRAALWVMYGQTEASARLTYLPPARAADKIGSVGVPVDGVTLEIRDEAGAAVPPGVVGTVWARGPNVMLGYWRDEAATTQVLRDGWLCTGDVGRLDAEGFLYLSGRRGDIIKVGAHRVHPGDVEDAIAELPEVAEAAVVGMEDELLGETIAAFVVPRPGVQLDVLRVRRHCRERLPAYKVPKTVEVVDDLPRTANGKVRRAALRRGNSTTASRS
jgi:acyl-CoA synthetase (AMP-forming)/AMP-acid ligase II